MRTFICLLFLAITQQALSATITQQFNSSWTVSPWNNSGDIAAMQWHYLPYQPWSQSLGTLNSVEVHTVIDGLRENANEDIRIRYGFFTGWSPADYQFGREFYLPSGTSAFSHTDSYTFASVAELEPWISYQYYPPAHYYFESRTVTEQHSISATTTLEYMYLPSVPEPASLSLALFGSLIIRILGLRRRSP